jgi:hypothetical protein
LLQRFLVLLSHQLLLPAVLCARLLQAAVLLRARLHPPAVLLPSVCAATMLPTALLLLATVLQPRAGLLPPTVLPAAVLCAVLRLRQEAQKLLQEALSQANVLRVPLLPTAVLR